MKPTETTVLLFAAGLGTRLKPFTLSSPKALYPIQGEPMLEKNIKYLKKFGFKKFVINVHHFADKIENFLRLKKNFGVEIIISDERDELLETGGGLMKAQSFLNEGNFVIMNADILTDLDLLSLLEFHSIHKPLVTLAVSKRESSRKLLFDDENVLSGWKNLKTGENKLKKDFNEAQLNPLAFSGIHVISPKIFNLIQETGKFSIMLSYLNLMENHKILGFRHQAQLYDIGKPHSAENAETNFKPRFL